MMAKQTQPGTPSKVITHEPFAKFAEDILGRYRSKSKGTYSAMRLALQTAEGLGVKTTGDLTPELLDRFEHALKLKGTKVTALAKYLSSFRTACSLAVRRGALECSPFAARTTLVLWLSRVHDHTILQRPTPSPGQLKVIFKHLKASAGNDTAFHRSVVLKALVAYAGLDVAETRGIRVSDVDFEAGVIHYKDSKGTNQSAMMIKELARLLRDWLRRKVCHVGKLMDEARVAEMRRLASEGHERRELAKRFGVGVASVRSIVEGLSWRNVTEDTKAQVRISDQEWLLPGLQAGKSGPWFTPQQLLQGKRGNEERRMLADAGRAAGIKNLTLRGLKRFHIIHVVGGPKLSQPREVSSTVPEARPSGPPCPVVLVGRSSRKVIIDGKPKGPLSRGGIAVMRVLIKAWPGGVTKFELEERSGFFTTAVKHLKGLKGLDKDFGAVVDLPGKSYGRYRLTCPSDARPLDRNH